MTYLRGRIIGALGGITAEQEVLGVVTTGAESDRENSTGLRDHLPGRLDHRHRRRAPFTALQILFVNLVMDGPPAMSLGVDPVSPDAVRRRPRPAHERILTRPRLLRILLASAVMAAGTLLVLANAPGPEPQLGLPTVAGTMAFVTFVFFQVFNLLNVRNDLRSVFSSETLENRSAFVAVAAVIVLLVLTVEMDVAHGFMTTTDLTSGQWLACVAIGSAILWAGELVKIVLRARDRHRRRDDTATS